jgi:DNA-binding NtrC family response regulator
LSPHDPHANTTVKTSLDRKTNDVSTFRIVVVEGPAKGASLVIAPDSPGAVFVGSGPGSDLVLPDRFVSRRHASLEAGFRSLRLVDVGSTNGTSVNGVTVRDATLHGGEVIRIGEAALRVELLTDSQPIPLVPVESFGRLLGTSVAMRRLYPLFQRIAASNLPVVIEGETGTGKELLAESIHEMGPRRSHPFLVFECAAATGREKAVEAILFGEEERSKSKSTVVRRGVFEEADRGTLLLDEVSELPLTVQAKLLRVLERGELVRVGGDHGIRTDVRILATTRRNIDREVEGGKFRDDLFFRLAGLRVVLPPLRDREGDVRFIATQLWQRLTTAEPISEELLASFDGYAWPGNIRELANAVARKVQLGDLYPSTPSHTTMDISTDSKVFDRVFALNLPFPEARARVVAEFERYFVERTLAKHDGNVSHAAAASGIARRYFQLLKTRSRE